MPLIMVRMDPPGPNLGQGVDFRHAGCLIAEGRAVAVRSAGDSIEVFVALSVPDRDSLVEHHRLANGST